MPQLSKSTVGLFFTRKFSVEQESISPTFYWRYCANILGQIKSLTFTASTKKLRAKLLYEKDTRKMLEKLTPGMANVRPAGHTWPAKHLYVAQELQLKLFK
jgi:hypothetical protein